MTHPTAGHTQTWRDDFDGPAGRSPDPAVWGFELGAGGWGLEQHQCYTSSPANAALDGAGHLAVTARQEPDGQITSARLITKDRLTVGYGRVEARIKVPEEQGMWPAFWMLGDDIDEVGWPDCGEIDIMEYVAVDPSRVHGTVHGPGYCGLAGGIGHAHDADCLLADDFHRYAVLWSPQQIQWLLDDHVYFELSPADVPGRWPFDHGCYLLVNLAVGGTWPGNDVITPVMPATMLVDWVQVSRTAAPS